MSPQNNSNSEYWAERFRKLEEETFRQSAAWIKNSKRQFNQSLIAIKEKVAQFYQQFENVTGMSLAETKRAMKKGELKEFKITVDEYIKKGKSLDDNFDPDVLKELQMASSRVRVSRYEAIKYQIQAEIAKLYGTFKEDSYQKLGEAYENRYYQTAYEMRSLGFSFARINKKQIKAALDKPWRDGHFSTTIWENQKKLIKNLTDVITQSVITGKSYLEATKALEDRMNVGNSNCARIISTEMAAVSSKAQQDMFKELDVKKYIIVATLDDRTSQICQSLDGKIFDQKDYKTGETAPPFHVNCRSTTAPYFKDMKPSQRIARKGGNGRSEYVDNMTYREWAKKNNIKPVYGLWEPSEEDLIKKPEPIPVKLGGLENSFKPKNKEAMVGFLEKAPDKVKKIWNACSDDFEYGGSAKRSHFSPYEWKTYFDQNSFVGRNNEEIPGKIPFHEQGHQIDYYMAYLDVGEYDCSFCRFYKNGALPKQLKQEFENSVEDFFYDYPEKAVQDITEMDLYELKDESMFIEEMVSRIENGEIDLEDALSDELIQEEIWESRKSVVVEAWINHNLQNLSKKYGAKEVYNRGRTSDISDMVEACTSLSDKFESFNASGGHGEGYWNMHSQSTEFFAEAFSAYTNDEIGYEMIKTFFPKSEKIFQEILDEMVKIADVQ